uniref:Uncharacterized protein n=1 Tax=Arundo donax TaxID=35708 RepID=A0A0A9AI74_ARUDO
MLIILCKRRFCYACLPLSNFHQCHVYCIAFIVLTCTCIAFMTCNP